MSLISSVKSLGRKVKEFDDDEEGMETIQVVMLLGLAAVVAVLIFAFWGKIKKRFGKKESDFEGAAP